MKAIVFPGQGSQRIGMLADVAERYPELLETFDVVSETVGYDVWRLTQDGPEAQLNQTAYTQIAMLAADVAMFRLLEKRGLAMPKAMAGHSLGEYPALVCAKSLDLSQAARLVHRRGTLMQTEIAPGLGMMAAIVGLSDEEVQALCRDISQPGQMVTPANYNAIGQVVIAGHTAAVESAITLAEERGARLAKAIAVSAPCHCTLLEGIAEQFAEDLAAAKFSMPACLVISNVTAQAYRSPEEIRQLLTQQLYMPVRWVESIRTMQSLGIDDIIECGAGAVLAGLIKRIDRAIRVTALQDVDGVKAYLET
ncbi:MAG: ACP S-malonyltransferase [Legionellaceae bacterium]|nr:ACP S-malonyltransferase [Legionellaceae bacterium]